MPKPFNTTKKDGKEVAADNELKVLKIVRQFGHLRRHEIALGVWPRSPPASAHNMACRTVKKMVREGLLLDRVNALGGISLVLAAKGVARLREHNIVAQEGYDLGYAGVQFWHRTLGTCYLLEKAKSGAEVFGEFSLIKDWGPVPRSVFRERFNKIPDGLLSYPRGSMGLGEDIRPVDWVEVESAFKVYDEVRKALSLFTKSPELNRDGTVILNRLVFVYDRKQRHEGRLLRYIKQFLRENPALSPETILHDIVFASCDVAIPFVWSGVHERTAQQLMEIPGLINEDESMFSTENF